MTHIQFLLGALKQSGMTWAEIATQVGCERRTIVMLARGMTTPRQRTRIEIERVYEARMRRLATLKDLGGDA